MRTKYFIETKEKADKFLAQTELRPKPGSHAKKPPKKSIPLFGDILSESRYLENLMPAQAVYVNPAEKKEWEKTEEPKHSYLDECLKHLSDASKILKHFSDGHEVEYLTSKQHTPIADLNKTNLPSKYIVMRFTDDRGKQEDFPLDRINRVEIRKTIRTAQELMREQENMAEHKIQPFLEHATRFYKLDEIEKSPISKRSQSDHHGRR